MPAYEKITCELCGVSISKSNYTKHLRRHIKHPESFKQRYKTDHEGTTCKFCGKELPTRRGLISHESCCFNNPERKLTAYEIYGAKQWAMKTTHIGQNKGQTKDTSEVLRKQSEKMKLRYATGELVPPMLGKHHSEETKLRLSGIALKNKLGGHPNRKQIDYKGVVLDSSLEYKFALKLDELQIKWERCGRFNYIDSNQKKHSYTPDFYLPEYDIYFDPKNDYLIEHINPALGFKDADKIHWVCAQNNIVVYILSEADIENFDIALYKPSSSNG